MKTFVLFTLLAAVSVYVNAAVVDPVEVDESVELYESEVGDELGAELAPRAENEPGAVFEFGEVEDGPLGGEISARNRLIFSNSYRRNAIANVIQVLTVTIRFSAATRITRVRVAEIGATQLAAANIIDGGVNRNFVVIRFTSARGRGFNFNVQIYGN